MKKFVFGSLVATVLTVSSLSVVGGQEPAIVPPTEVNTTPGMLTNMIDDINVPWEILEYVQMKYEGHAVTKAEKINRFGKELYKLRVDRDSEATDYDSIALLFDMQWKLVGEEKYAMPPPPPPKPAPAPVQPQQQEPEKPEGGQGGAESDKPQEPTEVKPDSGGSGGPQPDPAPTTEESGGVSSGGGA
jgi:hypothetical protein